MWGSALRHRTSNIDLFAKMTGLPFHVGRPGRLFALAAHSSAS